MQGAPVLRRLAQAPGRRSHTLSRSALGWRTGRSPSLSCRAQINRLEQWLQQVASRTQAGGHTRSLSASIINRADSLDALSNKQTHWAGPAPSGSSLSSSAAAAAAAAAMGNAASLTLAAAAAAAGVLPTPPPSAAPATSSSGSHAGILLRQQLLDVPDGFAVPSEASVPVHQLVAVWASMLRVPQAGTLPTEAKAGSMAAKWRMLQLPLLLHDGGNATALEASLQQLLAQVLFTDFDRKLAKVMANPKIPAPNKQLAQRRHLRLRAACIDELRAWAHATAASPTFALLQPGMAALQPAVEGSVVMGLDPGLTPGARGPSATSGKLMEEAAVQAVQDALPEGWSLMTSLHLLGIDGQLLTNPQRGCKYEVDALVLDEAGVAVAVVEVKLAAANPIMALVNDVSSLLKLVDTVAGRTITCLTRQPTAAAAAAAAAAATAAACAAPPVSLPAAGTGSAVVAAMAAAPPAAAAAAAAAPAHGTDLTRRLAAMQARSFPDRDRQGWQPLQVTVHPQVGAVYVLGKDIGAAAISRGLSSLTSSSALKLLARSPAALAAALGSSPPVLPLGGAADWQAPTAAGGDSHCGSSSSSSTSEDDAAAELQSVGSLLHGQLSLDDDDAASSSTSSSSTSSSRGLLTELSTNNNSSSSSSIVGSFGGALLSPRWFHHAAAGQRQQQQPQPQQHSGPIGMGAHITSLTPQPPAERLSAARGRIRASLHLSPEQQELLTDRIHAKLAVLQQRVKIYCLCRAAGASTDE